MTLILKYILAVLFFILYMIFKIFTIVLIVSTMGNFDIPIPSEYLLLIHLYMTGFYIIFSIGVIIALREDLYFLTQLLIDKNKRFDFKDDIKLQLNKEKNYIKNNIITQKITKYLSKLRLLINKLIDKIYRI